MIVVFENLDKVAPKEEHNISKASIRFIIEVLYYLKKDTAKKCINLILVALYQEVNNSS
jgi:hypothetical protein